MISRILWKVVLKKLYSFDFTYTMKAKKINKRKYFAYVTLAKRKGCNREEKQNKPCPNKTKYKNLPSICYPSY